jgi:hypothetical protein
MDVTTLWRGIATVLLAGGGALLALGVPATYLLGLAPRAAFIARFVLSGGLYLLAGALLHPGAWARTPFGYPVLRAPMMAFLPFAAGTAIWG